MRKGSNFKGSSLDLDDTIRKYLPRFIESRTWLDNVETKVSSDEFINICEAIAESIERGYLKGVKYLPLMNKTLSFQYNCENGTNLLTESGKIFLNTNPEV